MYKNLVLAFLSILFLTQNSYAKVPLAGDPAPNFSLTSVDGKKITLSDLKGKVVLVGMFHICVPCMKQALEFNKVKEQLSSGKLTILGINTNGDSKASVIKYLNGFPENVEFSGKGDSGEAIINLEKNADELEEISVTQESVGTYSLEYLNPIVKAVGGTAGSIICEFSSAKPLRIEFKVTNIGRIHFYLAPRVES